MFWLIVFWLVSGCILGLLALVAGLRTPPWLSHPRSRTRLIPAMAAIFCLLAGLMSRWLIGSLFASAAACALTLLALVLLHLLSKNLNSQAEVE